MSVPVVSPVLQRVKAIPAPAWIGIVLVFGVVAMVWHRFYQDDNDKSWLDPEQPPINLDFAVDATSKAVAQAAKLAPAIRLPKPYPGNLVGWDQSWLGDC